MGLTSIWGIYHDDGSAPATGRQQDVKQALSVDAALSRVQSEAEMTAKSAITAATAGLLLIAVDAPEPESYLVGSNFRGYTVVTRRNFQDALESSGAVVEDDVRILSIIDAPSREIYTHGPNYRALPPTTPAPTSTTPGILPLHTLRDYARRKFSAPRHTTAKAVVALVVDDYPADTLNLWAPEMDARGFKWSWCMNANTFDSGYMYSRFSAGKSWEDVRALDPARVEIVNHGASHQDVSAASAMQDEIAGSRRRLMQYTGQDVLGFAPPGCDFPEGVRFKTSPTLQTAGETGIIGTAYELYAHGHHAWATGIMDDYTIRQPVHRLDGAPRMGAGRTWIQHADDRGVKPGGIGDAMLKIAMDNYMGVIFSLHACYIEGGMLSKNMTLQGLRGFLDRLKALADAGEIEIVTLSEWHFTTLGDK